jgi:hypothetical protein
MDRETELKEVAKQIDRLIREKGIKDSEFCRVADYVYELQQEKRNGPETKGL